MLFFFFFYYLVLELKISLCFSKSSWKLQVESLVHLYYKNPDKLIYVYSSLFKPCCVCVQINNPSKFCIGFSQSSGRFSQTVY